MIGMPERPDFGFTSIGAWKAGVQFNSWLFLGVGTAAIVCGIGIAALKEWARRSWLIASVLLVGFVVFAAVGYADVWRRYVELLAFALPSFIVLYGRNADRAI